MNASNLLANSPRYGYSLGRIVRPSNKSISTDTAETKTSVNPFGTFCTFGLVVGTFCYRNLVFLQENHF